MTKKEYLQIKEELKELAHQIKEAKPIYKEKQRALSRFQRVCGLPREMRHRGAWDRLKEAYWNIMEAMYKSSPKSLSHLYRHHHIAYCLIRGRTRDEIEQPKHNMPVEMDIRTVLENWGYKTIHNELGQTIIDWSKAPYVPPRARKYAAKEMLLV